MKFALVLAVAAAMVFGAITLTRPASAQSASPEVRIEAYIAGLSSGDASAFERAARENLTPQLFATRTPEQRAQVLARISGDFGRMEITNVTATNNEWRAAVRGSTGLSGTFVFAFEGAEQRISRVSAEVRLGPGQDGPNVPPAPINSTMSADEMRAAVGAWIQPFVAQDDFAGAVLIARDGAPYVALAYGPLDRERHIAADTSTRYNIASIGKRFTQTAVARLIQEGRLSLATTIGDVIPDYPNTEGRPATVEQLINMQGGIGDIFSDQRESWGRSRLDSNHGYYEFVASLPQRFTPGAQTEYCNGCFVVLGEMIERISGMRFEDYVRSVVFEPAGMAHTAYDRTDRLPPNTAISYDRTNGPGSAYAAMTEREGVTGSGAGGLYSTTGDLLAFDNALRDGRLLNPQWTAWVLDGVVMDGRNTSPLDIRGGGPGASAAYTSNGRWAVFVTANVQRPLPFQISEAIARPLVQ
ncbi:MAG: serine hydrolase domain-containing protein [Hyphomonadaceae bacterium]